MSDVIAHTLFTGLITFDDSHGWQFELVKKKGDIFLALWYSSENGNPMIDSKS